MGVWGCGSMEEEKDPPTRPYRKEGLVAWNGLRGCFGLGVEASAMSCRGDSSTTLEARSSATGRESGGEDTDRSRAQPRIEIQNSLLVIYVGRFLLIGLHEAELAHEVHRTG